VKTRALLAMDLAFLVIAVVVVSPPLVGAWWLHALATAGLGRWLAVALVPVGVVLFLAGMTGTAFLVRLALPRLRPGIYPLRGHPQSRAWALHFALQRVTRLPLWSQLFFSFASLRTLLLRALGARVPWFLYTSNDAMILDASLLEAGPGTMFGGRSTVCAHFVESERLLLAPVKLGAEVQLLAGAAVSPGVTIGDGSVIGADSRLGPGVTLGEAVHIGMGCVLHNDVKVGDDAVIGHHVVIEAGARIGEGAVLLPGARVSKGAEIEAGAKVVA
jgi:acetyltransferase-like isoleucine patch superfamily enzyme